MKTVKTPKKIAEKVKTFMISKGIYNDKYIISKDKTYIYFPLIKSSNIKLRFPGTDIVDKVLKKKAAKYSLRQLLSSKLTRDELKSLKTSYDIVGNIAILEIDEPLWKKEKQIALALLKTNSNIKTVLRKSGIHEGVFRTQKLKYIAGKRTKEVLYRENNALFKFNVEKVYFSVRLSTERKRIYKLVKPRENILVMFSGCGIYPIVLSKNTDASNMVGIEINPVAHKYALKNLVINKVNNVKFYLGNVTKVVPKLKEKFDRILMPLPKSAGDFLETAFLVSKKGTIIHFYDFSHEDEFDLVQKRVKAACKRAGFCYRKLGLVKCGQYSPHVYRICLDFKVL
jgi:tRNA (guanine37-N1)-methyltransferase